MSFFLKRIFLSLINFIKENKIYFFILLLFTILGIIFGIENVKTLKSDLDLSDITDVCFSKASNREWNPLTFYLIRLSILIVPVIIALCSFNIFIALSTCIIAFVNSYFYSFNFILLVYNLKIVGLFYVYAVCLPCYMIYLLCLLCLYLLAFKRFVIRKKYNNYHCLNSAIKEIRAPILSIIVIFSIAVLYEIIFLYLIYNKYIFAM